MYILICLKLYIKRSETEELKLMLINVSPYAMEALFSVITVISLFPKSLSSWMAFRNNSLATLKWIEIQLGRPRMFCHST